MPRKQDAVTVVRAFLEALESGDLKRASSLLAEQASIVFPGAREFDSLDQVADFSSQRYQRIGKTLEVVDAASYPDGSVVVYVAGQLRGVNLYGVEFSGIRFIDRFVLRGGSIVSQEVWNDLGETRVLDRKGSVA
jgi:hypothetical protein